MSSNFRSIAIGIIDAFQPVIDVFLETLPFPLNGGLALIWGGIKEIILKILFA